MEQGLHGGNKKAKVGASAAAHPAKEVEMEGGGGGGAATATVAVATAEESNTSRERINLWFPKAKFYCRYCSLLLKTPIFLGDSFIQREAGHFVCHACHVEGCCDASCKYGFCSTDQFVMDDYIISATRRCVYEEYGCSSYFSNFTYCEIDDHERSCPCATCGCPEKGCLFRGSPAMLIDHIANEHSQCSSILLVRYGQELKLTLTAALRWYALVGEDRSLFLVSRRESGTDTAVSVCCVRANGAGDGTPQYNGRLELRFPRGSDDDDGEVVVMKSKVRSSPVPCGWPTPTFMGLLEQLDDTVTFSIRIDQLQPAGSTTIPDMDQPLRMERGLHGGGKKAKVGASAALSPAKQVAMVLEGNTSGFWINLWVNKAKFHCHCCTNPLRPPIKECDVGHLTCSECCCADYSRRLNPALENFILSATIPCPYHIYGCLSYVAYCGHDDHQHACPWAPCFCPEKGCPFVGSPSMLIDHITNEHSQARSIVALRYDEKLNLTLTAALRWHALVGQDGSLFLVSLGTTGQDTAVSLVCVRANAATGKVPQTQYMCRLELSRRVNDGDVVAMECKVPSSRLQGERPTPNQCAFMGMYQPLDATVARLSICIGKVQPSCA